MRINDELVTLYNSSQTCPYTLQTVAQPDCCATKFKPVWKSSNCCTKSQTTPYTIKQFAQQPVLRKLFDRVWGPLRTSYPQWVCCLLVKERTGHNPLFVLRNIRNRPKEEMHLGPKRETFIAYMELDGRGIESRWDLDFPQLSRPALRSNQPLIQWVPCVCPG